MHSFRGASCIVGLSCSYCFATDIWGMSGNGANWPTAARLQHFQWLVICFLIASGILRLGYLLHAQIQRILTDHAAVLEGSHLAILMHKYSLSLRVTYVLCSLVWVACAVFCALPGLFFDEFYVLGWWCMLYSAFNLVGVVFAGTSFLIASPAARQVELQLHDLVIFTAEQKHLDSRMAEETEESGGARRPSILSSNKHRTQCVRAGTFAFPERTARFLAEPAGYPCYVMPLGRLVQYARLPTHEQALSDGALEVVHMNSYRPCRSSCYFISHTWIANDDGSRTHPDGEAAGANPKLSWMKSPAARGLFLHEEDTFVWMDVFSIPQAELGRQHQRAAIASLPQYARLCGRFVPLVRSGEFVDQYLKRGWCSTECIAALTPKIDPQLRWRIGPPGEFLCFHHYAPVVDEPPPRQVKLGVLHSVFDAAETEFTDERDRKYVEEIVANLAQVMLAYECSGSSAWDHTDNVANRPAWLKAASAGQQTEVGASHPTGKPKVIQVSPAG